jgi:PhzF family phenazine biosynthesis protein
LAKDEITIRVKEEKLAIKNRISQDNSVYITAPKPLYHPMHLGRSAISQALGINLSELDGEFEPALINGGLNTLIVPVAGLQTALSMRPDEASLKAFCLDNQMDIALIFCRERSKRESGFRTRVFAPKFGYLEDPATGSGNSAFGYYLLKTGQWDGAPMVIEQGPSREDPNIVRLTAEEKKGTMRVLFGGGAVARIDGEYCL